MNAGLIHGNCLEILPTLPAESVDLIVTDPPYNVSRSKDIDRGSWEKLSTRRKAKLTRDFGDWDKFTPENFEAFTLAWLAEAARVMKPESTAFVFFTLEGLGMLERLAPKAGLRWLQALIWHKTNPAPNFQSQRRFVRSNEGIGWMQKGTQRVMTWNGGPARHDFIETGICQGSERLGHPTQKPLAVIEPLILVASAPEDLILDPFAGTGTTLVAAKRLGRRYIGIEQDERYAAIARSRLSQGSLFEPGAPSIALDRQLSLPHIL